MAIHWFQTDKLVQALARDAVSEVQSLWYAIVSNVIVFGTMYYSTWAGGQRNWLLLIELVAVCAIAVIGLQECFKANGGSGGSHFLKRLYCLGVPVGLKLTIASIVVGQVIYFGAPRVITPELFRDPYFVYQLVSFFVAGIFTVCYFWRIAYHMERILKVERSNPLMQPTGQERPAAD